MKTAFVVTHLTIACSYLSAICLAQVGILPTRVLSLPGFLLIYLGVGLLGMLFHDYGRNAARPARRVASPTRSAKPVSAERSGTATAWAGHTLSA